jgi:transposase
MEARTVNNLPPAAPHDHAVRCLLAIELSKKSWIVAVNTPLSDKISRYTLEAVIGRGSWIYASGFGRELPEK